MKFRRCHAKESLSRHFFESKTERLCNPSDDVIAGTKRVRSSTTEKKRKRRNLEPVHSFRDSEIMDKKNEKLQMTDEEKEWVFELKLYA